MGTRSMNALMVKAHHKPTTEAAAHFKDVATVVEMKGLGTAWVWETNTQPLWARSSVNDLVEEVQILGWITTLPADDFRLVRVGDEIGDRGNWKGFPLAAAPNVKKIVDEHAAEMNRLSNIDHDVNDLVSDTDNREVMAYALETLVDLLKSPTSADRDADPAEADRKVSIATELLKRIKGPKVNEPAPAEAEGWFDVDAYSTKDRWEGPEAHDGGLDGFLTLQAAIDYATSKELDGFYEVVISAHGEHTDYEAGERVWSRYNRPLMDDLPTLVI